MAAVSAFRVCRQEAAEGQRRTAQDEELDLEEEGADEAEGLHEHTSGHQVHRQEAEEGRLRAVDACVTEV